MADAAMPSDVGSGREKLTQMNAWLLSCGHSVPMLDHDRPEDPPRRPRMGPVCQALRNVTRYFAGLAAAAGAPDAGRATLAAAPIGNLASVRRAPLWRNLPPREQNETVPAEADRRRKPATGASSVSSADGSSSDMARWSRPARGMQARSPESSGQRHQHKELNHVPRTHDPRRHRRARRHIIRAQAATPSRMTRTPSCPQT